MAATPLPRLQFKGECPDCGNRLVELPRPLPDPGDDFDWKLRDYDGFRLFMMQELATRFPERGRWTPADLEVVIVEALAAALDGLSDKLDRVSAEAFLDSARRPESVRRLLSLIGYDAVGLAEARREGPFAPGAEAHPDDERNDAERFDDWWLNHPEAMEQARKAGPWAIRTQRRMVTVEDYVARLEEHPVVSRVQAWEQRGGGWPVIHVAVIGEGLKPLDRPRDYNEKLWEAIRLFHKERDLALPPTDNPSPRRLLEAYVDGYRMLGQEVRLRDHRPVGIVLSLSVDVDPNFFQSEVRHAVAQALGGGPGGFFAPGRLKFGEDLYASDLFETLLAVDGVRNVCLNRFKRVGGRFPDRADEGVIRLEGLEVAVCDNDPSRPQRGYVYPQLSGGKRG